MMSSPREESRNRSVSPGSFATLAFRLTPLILLALCNCGSSIHLCKSDLPDGGCIARVVCPDQSCKAFEQELADDEPGKPNPAAVQCVHTGGGCE